VTLGSVLDQTLDQIEVIVSDNAADEETAAVVESFGDSRLTYAPLRRDIGMYANLTRCLSLGTAPYVAMLADDDLLMPTSLERRLERIERDASIAVVSTAHSVIDGSGRVLRDDVNWSLAESDWELDGASFIRRSLSSGVFFHLSTVLLRRAALAEEKFEEVGGYTDLGTWLRIATRGARFAYIHEPLTAVREHVLSESAAQGLHAHRNGSEGAGQVDTQTLEQVRQMQYVRRQFLEREGAHLADRPRLWRAARRDARKRMARLIVKEALAHGSVKQTVARIREAGEIDPAIVVSGWSLAGLVVAVGGRPAWQVLSTAAAPARRYWAQ
jgi:hypothetical protein